MLGSMIHLVLYNILSHPYDLQWFYKLFRPLRRRTHSEKYRWVCEENWKWGEICWCRTLYTSCALCNSVDICSKDLRQGFTDFFYIFTFVIPCQKGTLHNPQSLIKIQLTFGTICNLVHTKAKAQVHLSWLYTIHLYKVYFQEPYSSLHLIITFTWHILISNISRILHQLIFHITTAIQRHGTRNTSENSKGVWYTNDMNRYSTNY